MTLQTRTTDLQRMLRRAPHWAVTLGLIASVVGLLVGVSVWIVGVLALQFEIDWALPLIGCSAVAVLVLRLTGILTARLAGIRP